MLKEIKLEKGMYQTGKSFASVLEELDPSADYAGSPLSKTDAYARQLKRFNIRTFGAGSDSVEKFFQTSDSAVLFPEFVSRKVNEGFKSASLLDDVVATYTKINAMDYRTIKSNPSESAKALLPVAEGAEIPETSVAVSDSLVSLTKRGRMLVASYEALRFQKLDLFAVTLRQIGAHIARTQFADAVHVLLNGDGATGAAQVISTAGTNVSYADLINLWNSFEPYEMNTLIASPDIMAALLQLPEMQNAQAGLTFQGTGKSITPLGAKLLKSSAVPAGTLIGLDKTCALEMVQAGEITTEFDKLINRQLERAAITQIAGFARIFDSAVKAAVYGG
jgi:hypothetical protein